MSTLKVNDIVYVTGYARVRFRIKATKGDKFHLVYAAVNNDPESEFGWCTEEEITKE